MRLFAIVALIALAWQSIVVQSHVHLDTNATPAAIHRTQTLQHRSAPADTPADCPICRQFAHAGHYLSPGGFPFTAPAVHGFWRAIGSLAGWIGERRSHAWHSRGPPSPLRT
ncbi:hypothetical protein [Sphingomonas sp. MMS24-J13]|uniref:hypothetical protein n=1 Tax=Sphingomonas sp. MMS24-J13 TaxID=3238686 RepID=UPI00384E7DFE